MARRKPRRNASTPASGATAARPTGDPSAEGTQRKTAPSSPEAARGGAKPAHDETDNATLLSVEEIRAKLKVSPADLELRLDLADALMDRYLFGDDDHPAEDEKEISHLTRLVSTLPSSEALDHRAYLDYHAQRDEAFIRSSVKWLSHVAQAVQPPYDCNELYANLIVPFDEMPAGLVTQWAATLNKGWPESAAVLTLRGLAKLEDENKPEEALDCFGLALAKDSEYWLAAWNCARIYAANKNWQGAFSYYSKALNTGAAQQLPGLQFDAAWCLGQLKRYPAEEKRYRLCLAGC